MLDLNRVFLCGNLTRDPEVRHIPSGASLAEFCLAVNRRVGKDKPPEVLFIDVTAWEKTAEFCGKYLKKGSGVFVEGRLKQEKWTDKETGKERSKIGVVAERVQFAESKGADGAGSGDSEPAAAPEAVKAGEETAKAGRSASEDDLPF